MPKQKDLKQSIKVAIRIRPILDKQFSEDPRVCVKIEQSLLHLCSGNQSKKFSFDTIFFNQSQQQIFNKLGTKCTKDVLEGYNCTIFAYGHTGAGKTYTMMGSNQQDEIYSEQKGLIPRTIDFLFKSIDGQQKNGVEFSVKCSYLQIYNEQIVDLLNKSNVNLHLREDTKKGVYVEGISEQLVTCSEDALLLLAKGSKLRRVSSTIYNQSSSRSHSVFKMQIESKYTKNGISSAKCRQFNFIDLAGSQRTKLSTGARLRQGCNINKSLMNLSTVIYALSETSVGKIQHINYRSSKLTFLLKDSLGGNSKTTLIANIHPAAIFYQQTLSTLGFARRAKLVKREKALINEDTVGSYQSMKRQIKRLNQEITALMNHSQQSSFEFKSIEEKAFKMPSFINQFIQQEIDKQTHFQTQIVRLKKKVAHLQEGIKQYSNNQIHLRMIISIYQDKISRLKKTEEKINNKISTLDENQEESSIIISYFKNERENFIKIFQNVRFQAENNLYIKQLLKQAKLFRQDENLSINDLLLKNTDYLTIINQKLNEIKAAESQVNSQSQFNQKLKILEAEYSKKQEQVCQRLDQANLELSDYICRYEQNQRFLEESLKSQMELQQQYNKIKQANQSLLEQIKRQQQIANQYKVSLTVEISQKDNEIAHLQENIQNLQNQLLQFSIQQSRCKQRLQIMQNQILLMEHVDTQKTKEITSKIQQLQISNERISKQTGQIAELKILLQKEKESNFILKKVAQQLSQQIATMKRDLQQVNNQLNLTKDSSSIFQKKMRWLQKEKIQLQASYDELNMQLIKNQQQLTQSRDDLKHSEQKMKGLSELQAEQEIIRKKAEDLLQQVQRVKTDKAKLQSQIKNFSAELRQSISLNTELKEKLSKYEIFLRKNNKELQELCAYKQKAERRLRQTQQSQTQIEEQISSKQRIFKQLCNQKQDNLAMKSLIQNLKTQINHLQNEIQEKDVWIKKTSQKQSRKSSSSEHYLKTIELLEKSRSQQLDLKKQNDELKKVMLTLKQSVMQKQSYIKQVQKKSSEYCEKLQHNIEKSRKDYQQLEKKYEILRKCKVNHEKNHDTKLQNEMKALRSSSEKLAQRNQQMQVKIKKANLNSLKLQRQYEQVKRSDSFSLIEQNKNAYVHRLKAQIASIKTQRTFLLESLNKQREERAILKQLIKNGCNDIKIKLQLQKKYNENRNLTELIFQIINQLKICIAEPKAKLEVIRNLILGGIKQKFEDLIFLKDRIKKLEKKLFIDGSAIDFAADRQDRQLRTIKLSNNQRLLTQQNSSKCGKYKDSSIFQKNFSSQNMRDYVKFNAKLKYNQNEAKKFMFE